MKTYTKPRGLISGALLFAVSLLGVQPAKAQERGSLFLEPVIGFSSSFGNFGTFDDSGEEETSNGLEESSLVGFGALVRASDLLSFEARALIVPTVLSVRNDGVNVGFDSDVWLFTGSVILSPWTGMRSIVPYVLAGAGLRSVDLSGASAEEDLTWTVGGGARIGVTGFPALRVDLRDYFTVYDGVPEGQDSTIQNDLLLTLALEIRLF